MATATCRGIDVSAYQGTQDWAQHKADGLVFAFAKASEGQRAHDDRFATHITGIQKAGLVPGAYHFAWPNQDVALEASNYITAVRPHAGRGFCHWLDLERYSDGRNYRGRNNAQIREWVKTWLDLVGEAFPGQRVGVYTSASDLQNGHVPAGIPLWYPAYPWGAAAYSQAEARGRPSPAGREPLFWQFTSQPIDRSICYLSAAGLRAWAAGTTEEEDVALTADEWKKLEALIQKASFVGVWNTDTITAPKDNADIATNPTWAAQSYLRDIDTRVRALQKGEAAQTAAITQLASMVGSDVDTAAVVAAVQAAIADAVVKVDVAVTGADAS